MQTGNWSSILLKSVVVAVCAGLVSWVYALTYAIVLFDGWTGHSFPITALSASLVGSFAIGLPVALLTFWLSKDHLVRSPATLCMIVILSGVMMTLASYAIGSRDAAIGWGIPAFLAAITYGVLGWFWILKPLRKEG